MATKPKLTDPRCACCRPVGNIHIKATVEEAIGVVTRARKVRGFVNLDDRYNRVLFDISKTDAIRTLEWRTTKKDPHADPAISVHIMLTPEGCVCLGAVH